MPVEAVIGVVMWGVGGLSSGLLDEIQKNKSTWELIKTGVIVLPCLTEPE